MTPVVVEVEGGVATVIEEPDDVTVYIVDWDKPPVGECAMCGEPILLECCIEAGMHVSCQRTYEGLLR